MDDASAPTGRPLRPGGTRAGPAGTPASPERAGQAVQLLQDGYRCCHDDDHARAGRYAKQVVRRAPRDPEGHYFLGHCLSRQGRFRAAVRRFRRCEALLQATGEPVDRDLRAENAYEAAKACLRVKARGHCFREAVAWLQLAVEENPMMASDAARDPELSRILLPIPRPLPPRTR